MEGKEWVWDNGVIKEMTVNNYKKQIVKAKAKDLAEAQLRVFKDFISKL